MARTNLDPNSITVSPAADYSTSVDPTTILRDPRFLNDLRQLWADDGGEYLTNEQLVNRFYEDKTWEIMNTGSAVMGAADSVFSSDDQKRRLARIQNVYNSLPNFWQEGGRGTWEAVKDATPALLADPINYLTLGVGALAKGTNAARVATAAGRTPLQAIRSGTLAGMGSAARSEAIISGAQEGIVNTAEQVRDISIGNQDEFSLRQLAGRTALGAGLGGAFAGVLGAPAALAGARQGVRQADTLAFGGYGQDAIAGMTNREAATAAAQIEGTTGPYAPRDQANTQTDEAPANAPEQEVDPIEQEFGDAEAKVRAQVDAHRRYVIDLKAGEADPEVIGEAEARADAVARLQGMVARIRKEREQIIAMGETNDPAQLAKRDRRSALYNRDFTDLMVLLRETDTLDVDALVQRINDKEAALQRAAAENAADATPAAPEGQAAPAAEGDAVPANAADAPPVEQPVADAPAPEAPPATAAVDTPAPEAVAARAEGEAPTNVADEAPVDGGEAPAAVNTAEPAISNELRGEALAGGLDYRGLAPNANSKTGKLTPRYVRKAIKGRSNEADPYAAQAQRELGEMMDLLGAGDFAADDVRAAIRLLAQNDQFKSDPEDLVALFDHLNRQSDSVESSLQSADRALTETEMKKIKREARLIMKEQGLTEDAATMIAEARVRQLRGADKTPIRGTADAIENAGKLTTAGRTNTGRIQGFLKRSTPVTGGYGYAGARIRPNEFGFDAALLTARSGKGADVVPFTLSGRMQVMTRNGMVEMKKGDTAFADAVTGRPYDSMELALEVRGDKASPRVAENAAPEVKQAAAMGDDLRKFLADGDAAGFMKALQARKSVDQAAPTTAGERAVSVDKLPLTKGDKLLIARSKTDPTDIRMISPKQAKDGKDISAIIGKKGDKADPANWDIRYAPKEKWTSDRAALSALFDALPEEDAVSGVGARYNAGFATGMGEPLTPEKAATTRVTLTPEEIAAGGKYLANTSEHNANLLFFAIHSLEANRWNTRLAGHHETVSRLKTLYAAMDREVPQGLKLDNASRKESVKAIEGIMARYGSEQVQGAIDFLSRLGGDQSVGPNFNPAGTDNSLQLTYRTATGDIRQRVNLGNAQTIKPATEVLYHEVAHWAYFNVLTPKDRLDFWTYAERFYDPEGRFDSNLVRDRVGTPNRMETGPNTEIISNSMDSPQELFANQFAMWAMRNHSDMIVRDAKYWQRITQYVKAIFDRYFSKVPIDAELEPLFAKILPPDGEALHKYGVDANPLTDAGKHYQKRYVELKLLRDDLEDAFERDSADAIITAHGALVKYLLSVAPRKSTEARPNTGVLMPLKKRLRIIHNRIDDIDEIVSGKPFDYDSDYTGIGAEWLDMGVNDVGDPQEIADMLRDFYYNGYAGSFKPENGVPGVINEGNIGRTSTKHLIDDISTLLEGAYKSAEGRANLPAGVKPDLSESAGRAGGKASANARKAKGRKARMEKAVDAAARRTASTPANKRPRVDARNTKNVDPLGAEELRTKSIKDLRAMYVAHRGTPTGDQVALELIAKEKAQPLPPSAVPVPRELVSMREAELSDALGNALYAGDKTAIDQITYELRRRFVNKGRKKNNMPRIEAVYKDTNEIITREIRDSVGLASSDGIPPSARATVRELLSFVTHRDPEIQVGARMMTYRLMNLMGKTVRGNAENANVLTTGDIARIAGVDPSDVGTEMFVDMRAPEFRKLRADIRRLSVALNKGGASSRDAIREVAHMMVRSGVIPMDEMDAIREAYRLSTDATKSGVSSKYASKHANRIAGSQDDYLAEEWFTDALTDYLGEKTTRADILDVATDGNTGNLKLRNAFDRAIDRSTEYTAYMVNGMVGRQDVKADYRRLFMYGDMFDRPTSHPLADMTRRKGAVHPAYAADAAQDSIMSSSKTRLAKMRNFVRNTLSYDESSDSFVVFYHGTPFGYAFDRKLHPDAVLEPSASGNYGPGVYLADNPAVSNQVFANRPTTNSLEKMIEATDLPIEAKEDLMMDAIDLNRVRAKIAEYRRKYTSLKSSGADKDVLDDFTEALDDFVEMEQALLENLARNGVKADPLVLPTLIQVRNPADFQASAVYKSPDDPMIRGVIETLNMTDSTNPRALQKFAQRWGDGPLSGQETYKALIELHQNSGRSVAQAKAELNGTLEDLGYDGLMTTHRNTIDVDGAVQMANSNTYEGTSASYRGIVVFDKSKVKHVDADEFDEVEESLFRSEADTVPRGTVGHMVDQILTNNIESVADIHPGAVGEALEKGGANPGLTSAVMSMLRGRKLDVKEEQAVRKAGPLGYFLSQSDRMKKYGANWVADWYKGHFPDLHQKFAGKYMPIHHALRALPDADGKVRAWARAATASVGQSQPKSYQRIVKALRYGAGSRQEKALNADERKIWTQIRTGFARELRDLRAMGVKIGDRGENYFPQVWNADKIRNNRVEFLDGMKEYYRIERIEKNLPYVESDAIKFANGIYDRLAGEGEDGFFVPMKGGSRNPAADNMDYTRMIELEKYPVALKNLEPYLEDDLEFLLVKYFEGASRKAAHIEKMGMNSHAFYDYLMVADQGLDGITRLLSHNKEFARDFQALTPDGYVEKGTFVDTVRMPFNGDEGKARMFAESLLVAFNTGKAPAARKLLMDIAPRTHDGDIPLTYRRRVDAIVGALEDYKGKPSNLTPDQYEFMENSMRVAMKKPMTGTGSKALKGTSKAVRSFNNVTLLGFTTLTSLGDLALPIIRSGEFGAWAKGLYKWKTDPEYRRMLQNVGVAMENIVHERMVYMYGAVDNKMSHAFFNATMLTPWTDMNRQIAAATGMEAFKAMQAKAFKYADVPFEKRPAEYRTAHRFLKNYGLEDFLPEGQFQKQTIDESMLESNEALRKAIIRFADDSIFQPNPNDIPLWAQTPLGGMMFQLKSFPLMMTRLTGHVLREAKQGNFKPLMYLATVGPAFGMGALAAKDIIQFRGGDDERSPELRQRNILKVLGYDEKVHGNQDDFLGWYVEGIIMMGGLGLFGDVIHSAVTQADNGAYGKQRFFSALLGPAYSDVSAAFDVYAGAVDQNDSNAKERTAMRELATRIPIAGGIRAVREGIVDGVAGEANGRGGGSKNPWSNNWGKASGWEADWE